MVSAHDEQLAAKKQRTERVTKRILTEEEMSALSDRLMQVTKGMTITVRYFKEDTVVSFEDLVEISGEGILEIDAYLGISEE